MGSRVGGKVSTLLIIHYITSEHNRLAVTGVMVEQNGHYVKGFDKREQSSVYFGRSKHNGQA